MEDVVIDGGLTGEHSSICGLCARFARRENVQGADFAEAVGDLGTQCPYYQLHQDVFRAIITENQDAWWRHTLDWNISSWDSDKYLLEVPNEMGIECWDIYTEPGEYGRRFGVLIHFYLVLPRVFYANRTSTMPLDMILRYTDSEYWEGFTRLPGLEEADEPGISNDSPESWSFIERCRTVCTTHHALCHSTKTSRSLPPRLLKIESDGLILVSSDRLPPDSTYIALSYCWGPLESFRTTKDTLTEFRRMIPLATVPTVIMDTVTFALRVGERFIWIDRVCIQQDDKEDWARHSGIMDQIYEHAEMTVCAVTSNTVEEAYLGPSSISGRRSNVSTLSEWTGIPGSSLGEFRVRFRAKSSDFSYQWSQEQPSSRTAERLGGPRDGVPLDSRGWTFQERYLSRRCVRYEPQQIVWECATAQFLENYPFDTLEPPSSRTDTRALTNKGWDLAVSDFTRRKLSYAEDRISAIAGLASRYQRSLNREYLAGLWSGEFIYRLGWEIDNSVIEYTYSGFDSGEGPAIPGAPSWSWVSVSLPVRFGVARRPDNRYPDISVVSVEASPSTANPFGPVRYPAPLVLRARLLEAELLCRKQSPVAKSASNHRYTVRYKGGFLEMPVGGDCYLGKAPLSRPSASSPPRNVPRGRAEFHWRRVEANRSIAMPCEGDGASVKLLLIESPLYEGEAGLDDAFVLVLSPLGEDVRGLPSFQRIGKANLVSDIGQFTSLLADIRPDTNPETFCIV